MPLRVPFGRTRPAIARRMLYLAGLGRDEVLLDLGSGGGDVLLEAAGSFSSRAIGLELDPELVEISRSRVDSLGLADRAAVIRGDFMRVPLPRADVVALYLLPEANRALAARLLKELPEARVVAHRFPVPGWRPLEVDEYRGTRIYLYVPKLSATLNRGQDSWSPG